MRINPTVALCALLLLIVIADGSVVERRRVSGGVLMGRQEEGLTATEPPPATSTTQNEKAATTAVDSSKSLSTPTSSEGNAATDSQSKSAKGSKTEKATASAGAGPALETNLDGDDDSSSDDSASKRVYAGGLPIPPKVTPASSLAGVFMMILGSIYCFVGIRIKRLYIFLSTAFLCALGVAVLIVYVMNPPVKDAINAAYVTAAICTGFVVAGLAIIFPEVTEHLGCLLGGFCLSMWFLVLKPGGLITSVWGKVIMIGVCSVVTYMLAFHRITKPYALIFSLSFSGATIAVLGIDCFSKAGLKEFWLYIWALNDSIFPLGTNTYPHTRGVRVEIAGIVLICVLGIMSQVKLWTIVKERREARDAMRREQEAALEAVDEETGMRVENSQKEERRQWEAVYGNKDSDDESRPDTGNLSRTDSGIGDEDATKPEMTVEFVETAEMKASRVEHIQMETLTTTTPVERGADDDIRQIPASTTPGITDGGSTERLAPASARNSVQSKRLSSQSLTPHSATSRRHSARSSVEVLVTANQPFHPSVAPPPPVIPLPIPLPQETSDDSEDGSSVAARADSDLDTVPEDFVFNPGRVSLLPELDLPEFDRASSLAATCDDPFETEYGANSTNVHSLCASPEPIEQDEVDSSSQRASEEVPQDWLSNPAPSMSNRLSSSSAQPETRRLTLEPVVEDVTSEETSTAEKEAPTTDPTSEAMPPTPVLPTPSTTPNKTERKVSSMLPLDLAPASDPKSKSKPASSVSPSGNYEVPTHCSRIVKTYRTNEWAKHLSEADKPELDELPEPGVPLLLEVTAEKPAPVNIQDLRETAVVQPRLTPDGQRLSMAMTTSQRNSTVLTPIIAATAHDAEFRKSPVGTPGDQSPVVPHSPGHPTSTPSPIDRPQSQLQIRERFPIKLPEGTLMSKRESMVRTRSSLNNYERFERPQSAIGNMTGGQQVDMPRAVSAAGLHNRSSFYNAPSPVNTVSRQTSMNAVQTPAQVVLTDDMPLADRQQLLSQPSQQSLRQNTWSPPPVAQGPIALAQRRASPLLPGPSQEDLLRNWRDTLRAEQQFNNGTLLADQRRGEMLGERNTLATAERMRMLHGSKMGEVIEERMRQKDMLELHKEAMRKMQRSANKHVQ